jgi:DNA modification methylase
MKPYYEHAGITIYHGDCREILPTLPKCDLLLTDPPYGVNINTKTHSSGRHNGKSFGLSGSADFRPVIGDDVPFNPEYVLDYPAVILWGANHYSHRLPASARWLIWDKRCGGTPDDNADCEMAWCSKSGPARIYRQVWRGFFREGEENTSISGAKLHPTQKPIALMHWCLGFFPAAETVLDPFMGSGTTLVAAKNLGRKAIGIEIEERYCEIAAKRLSQSVFEFPQEKPTERLPQEVNLFYEEQGKGIRGGVLEAVEGEEPTLR